MVVDKNQKLALIVTAIPIIKKKENEKYEKLKNYQGLKEKLETRK